MQKIGFGSETKKLKRKRAIFSFRVKIEAKITLLKRLEKFVAKRSEKWVRFFAQIGSCFASFSFKSSFGGLREGL
jgi:hypothetical protein